MGRGRPGGAGAGTNGADEGGGASGCGCGARGVGVCPPRKEALAHATKKHWGLGVAWSVQAARRRVRVALQQWRWWGGACRWRFR
jgi:hypothetical protein